MCTGRPSPAWIPSPLFKSTRAASRCCISRRSTPSAKNVELGKGILDFPEIARLGLAQGTRELIVEQEAYTLPVLESIRVDADYMKSLQISE